MKGKSNQELFQIELDHQETLVYWKTVFTQKEPKKRLH